MATIQTNQKQINALEDVNQKLEVIMAINGLAFQSEGTFQISYSRTGNKKAGKKKEQNIILEVDSNEGVKLATILIQYKHKLKKEIDRLVKQFNLALDEEEKASLSEQRGDFEETEAISSDHEVIGKDFQNSEKMLAEGDIGKPEVHDTSTNLHSSSY